jgi:hypothetical protein
MPAAGLVKIVLEGTLVGGEIWETGFWMTDTGVDDSGTASAQAEIIWGTLTSTDDSGAMRLTALHLWDAEVQFTTVRVYAYTGGPKATYVGEYIGPAPLTGGAPGGPHPHQVAACMTTLTGLAGRSHRGRMYFPATGAQLDNGGQFVHFSTDTVVAGWAKAFTDINASDAGKVVLYSRTLEAHWPIKTLRLDSKPDVQRRRANRLQATFQVTAQVTP